ncbi:ran-binding protein 3-like [Phaethornis superciliosus]
MRNQTIPACKENVLYTGIQRSRAGYDFPVRPRHGEVAEPGLPKRRDWAGDCWALHQAAGLQEQGVRRPCPSASSSTLSPTEERCTERSVLAQPTFVFQKKDCPFKRPAEDPIHNTGNDFISCSRKRARSSSFTFQKSDSQAITALAQKRGRASSFTILPTFPPTQPVNNNNIFMTSALLQRKPDLIRSTKEGSLPQSQLWSVIRPAILQPPQALTCPENPVVPQATKKETHTKVCEDSSFSSAENSVSSKRAVRSSTTTTLSSSKTTQSHLFKDRLVQNSSNSDFVFGENMVDRVLSPGKRPKPCDEANSYKGEVTSAHIESFHVSPQKKTALLRNATLTESAAACISKPAEKILLDKVEVITGEEAEHNVLQINCKLFVFNKLTLTWTEKGRGSLRLNDTSINKGGMLQSRLIMRNQGSLRLILNTRLWDQMVIKKANRKSLCFTATNQEDHSIQVFLIQASSKDTGYLYAAIHHRLVALRSFAEQEPDVNQGDAEPEIAFQPLSWDSNDDDDEKIIQESSSGSVPKTQSLCKVIPQVFYLTILKKNQKKSVHYNATYQ